MPNLPPAGPGASSRREFLELSSLGFGGLALAHLVRADRASGAEDRAVVDPLAPRLLSSAYKVTIKRESKRKNYDY